MSGGGRGGTGGDLVVGGALALVVVRLLRALRAWSTQAMPTQLADSTSARQTCAPLLLATVDPKPDTPSTKACVEGRGSVASGLVEGVSCLGWAAGPRI